MGCFSNHQNIDEHTGGRLNSHNFCVVNVDVNVEFLGLQEPQAYYHTRTARPTCSDCKSKIGLEFLRCVTCVEAYNLVRRIAIATYLLSFLYTLFEKPTSNNVIVRPVCGWRRDWKAPLPPSRIYGSYYRESATCSSECGS